MSDINALKISLFQTQAVYRNPTSTEVIETYPLPPPSTVLGLISTMIKKQLGPGDINIAISGTYDALLRDYQWYKKQSITKPYPILVHALHGVNLTLHITTFTNNSLLDAIKNAFTKPSGYLYLGRAEDIIKINHIEQVTISQKNPPKADPLYITRPTYILLGDACKIKKRAIPYQLATFMQQEIVTVGSGKKQTSKMIRNFDWELYDYFEKGSTVFPNSNELLPHDGDEFVWWSMQNPNH